VILNSVRRLKRLQDTTFYNKAIQYLTHFVKKRGKIMAKQRIDPERDLRAWADALNAVADLQHAIVEEAKPLTMLDDWQWLDPFRLIVFGAFNILADQKKEADRFEAANGLKETATQALTQLREEAAKRKQDH
jgi:hypothetical protein